MAQADSVPSSSRQLITGESANQSANLPAVGVRPANRRYLTGVSHARVIVGSDEAPPLRLWREKRGDEPEGLVEVPLARGLEHRDTLLRQRSPFPAAAA